MSQEASEDRPVGRRAPDKQSEGTIIREREVHGKLCAMSVPVQGEGYDLRFEECGDTIFRPRYDSGALGLNAVPNSLVREFELVYEKEPVMVKLADSAQITALGEVLLTVHRGGKTSRAEVVVLGSYGEEPFPGLHTMREVWPERWSWWTGEVSSKPTTFWRPTHGRGPRRLRTPSYCGRPRKSTRCELVSKRKREGASLTHPGRSFWRSFGRRRVGYPSSRVSLQSGSS